MGASDEEQAARAADSPTPPTAPADGTSEPAREEGPEADPAGGGIGSEQPRVSEELQGWLAGAGDKTLGSLVELFGQRSFAILFVMLLGVPALPLPTGGATHVFEIIAVLLALELIAGREDIWLPQRWRRVELGGERQQRFMTALIKAIHRLERLSRPRLRFLFGHRASNIAFGLLAIAGSVGAFVAPPFTGLDTLPALGVVLLSLGVLLEDFLVVVVAVVVVFLGIALEVVLGGAAIHTLHRLL